jgi:hypothetical protein
MPRTTDSKRKPRANTEDRTFGSRKAAFRGAKRDMNVPMCKQPFKVLHTSQPGWKDTGMDTRNSRMYIFKLFRMIFGKREEDEIHIREDKPVQYPQNEGNQPSHFNTGRPPGKLRNHYFFKKK